MAKISLVGSIDLHIHSYPCLRPRILDDLATARAADAAGMRAIVLKSHYESTVGRAYAVDQAVGKLRVLGGIVLNRAAGGFNPFAVDAALQLGAKVIWMPSIDSAYHALVMGSRTSETHGTLTPLRDGRVIPEVTEILSLIAAHDAILGTSHLSFSESVAVLEACRNIGVSRVLLTHPMYPVPGLGIAELRELCSMGAYAEFGYSDMQAVGVERIAEAVIAVGEEKCVLISDAGHPNLPVATESLRVLAQSLHSGGLPEAAVRQMMADNPASLLGCNTEGG